MNCRRRPVRRSHSPGVIRPPRVDLPAAGVGIASQNQFFERISGPVSWAPTMTGALDQTTAAALRLGVAFGNCSDRMVRASRAPRPAPVICSRQAAFSPVPASRIAADTARSPAVTSAAKRNEPNIGELINIALEAIQDSNLAKLDGVFRNIDFNSEANLGRPKDRNRRLKNLLEDFAKPALDLRPSRVAEPHHGAAFFDLLDKVMPDWERRKQRLERAMA